MTNFAPEGFDPVADMNHQRPDNTPGWTESYAFWAYWEGRYLYMHYQRHPEQSSMWRGLAVVSGEDGSIVAAHSFGREYSPFGPGFEQIHAICERPFESYRVEVDTIGQVSDRKTVRQNFLPSLGNDLTPLKLELLFTSVSETYSPIRGEAAGAKSVAKWTHYTPCKVHGYVTIGDERVYIDTLGFRDHSSGVRSFEKMGTGYMHTGIFPSGRSYMALGIRSQDDDGNMQFASMGGLTIDGKVYYANNIEVHDNTICIPEPGMELGQLKFETDAGEAVINLNVTGQGFPLTNLPPCYEAVGMRHQNGDLVYHDWRLDIEWDGEKGIGGWETCVRLD